MVDDTGCPKPYAKKTEGAHFQYCPPLGRTARCNVGVFSAFAAPDRSFAVDVAAYRPAADFPDGKKALEFRSKIELARELVRRAKERGLRFSDVVFDSWYGSCDFLNALNDDRLPWITELAENRLVLYHGQWVRVDQLVTLIPSARFRATVSVPNRDRKTRRFLVASFTSALRGVRGKVLIVVARGSWDERDPRKVHVFATSHRSLDPGEVLRRFALRWKIETIFHETKDFLGLDQYQVRSWRGILRHWHLVLIAHTYLRLRLGRSTQPDLAATQAGPTRTVPTLGDVLRIHRALQDRANQRWKRQNPVLYQLIALTQPFVRVTTRAA